jgi:citrate synthase
MAPKTVKIEFEGKTTELPVIEGTEQEKAFDIGTLRAKTGLVTYDNGFANTSSCQSKVTFLDGELGILRYRGYPIEELSEHKTFLEVSYLLLEGELPNSQQLAEFQKKILENMKLPSNIESLLKSLDKNTHPMASLSASIVALSGNYNNLTSVEDKNKVKESMLVMLGQLPVIAAAQHRISQNQKPISPNKDYSYCENFLYMMRGQKPTGTEVKALDLLLILHADHEQNCSTSTVRMVGSSAANLFASLSAGICALWGPLHGGANQAVIEMLEEIHKNGGDIPKYVAMAKDKNSSFRLMGFGHRVYKNFDPRASIIKVACDKVLAEMGIQNPLLDIAKKLEEAALKDSYFKEKKLYPNVDFYSGIIYSALKIPVEMFTVMFAIGRLPGWMSHWKELNEEGAKIGRPRQVYTGQTERHVLGKSERPLKKAA